ncbi:MAG TPA: response regulator, partial [Burkholderiales bacterium]|nr:response regulator [Burkholderiales bacterium]
MAKILIADDHRANRDALAALLEVAGHYVLSANDGHQALNLAREHQPELVISDVLMPQMDGYELTRRLKLEPATAGISVVFYTAYFGSQDAKQLAQALGVADVLVKPSDNDVILRAVDKVL